MKILITYAIYRMLNICATALVFMCLASSAVNAKTVNTVLACNEITEQASSLTPFQKMLLQVGLFHLNQEFQDYFKRASIESSQLQDGILGRETLKALGLFCSEISPAQQQNVIESLFMYAAIRAVEPMCEPVSSVSLINSWSSNSNAQSIRAWSQKLVQQCEQSTQITFADNNVYFKPSQSALLSALLKAAQDSPQETLAPARLQQVYLTKSMFEKALAEYFPTLSAQQIKGIVEESKQRFDLPAHLVPADDCDCVEEFSYNDTLYHFYPAFMGTNVAPKNMLEKAVKASKDAVGMTASVSQDTQGETDDTNDGDAKQNSIDYSIVSRIGFQGIAIDASGSIADIVALKQDNNESGIQVNMTRNEVEQRWQQQRENFITQAHRYYSKADLVLEIQDYIAWDKRTIDSALNTIDTRLLSSVDKFERYSRYRTDRGLDGITLFFRDFAQDANHSKRINAIVKSFLNFKQAHYPNLTINILLDIPSICSDQYGCFDAMNERMSSFLNLCEIIIGSPQNSTDKKQQCIKTGNHDQPTVDNVLVLLPAPAVHSGFFLRRLVEERFVREASTIALNKIIPVVSPYPKADAPEQALALLKGNLYFNKQNFNGTGFWPMPMTGDPLYKDFRKLINEVMVKGQTELALEGEFQTNDYKQTIQGIIGEPACKFICTQRWYVRILFDLYAGIMLITLIFRNASCRLCKIIDQHYRVYYALWVPVLLLLLAMLGCDRFLEDKSEWLIVFFVALSLFVVFGKPALARKKQKDLEAVQVIEKNTSYLS